MTTLQIEYNKLLETQRANRAKEALTEREVQLKEAKQPYEIADLVAGLQLKGSQSKQAEANVTKILSDTKLSDATREKVFAEMKKIAADTQLSQQNRNKVLFEISKLAMDTKVSEQNAYKLVAETANYIKEAGLIEAQVEKTRAEAEKAKAEADKSKAQTNQTKLNELTTAADATWNAFQNVIKGLGIDHEKALKVFSGLKLFN